MNEVQLAGRSNVRRFSGPHSPRLCAALLLFVAAGGPVPRATAADEEEVVIVDNANQFVVSENQIEQWVFRNNNGNMSAKQKLASGLQIEIELIKTAVKLTEDQERKLELAGRGDVARFFASLEIQKKKFPAGSMTQEKFNEMWQQIQPLTARYQAGLHGRGSLFYKVLPIVLTSEQWEQYQQQDRERQRRHYRAKIEVVLTVLDQRLPMTQEQRQKLIDVVLAKSEPPKAYGQSDYYLIMWRISQIPDEHLKPIFDEQEWKVFTRTTQQVRGMKQWIEQMEGGLEDDPDKPAAQAGVILFE